MSNLAEGIHLIKFIVDGEYKCDPTLPIIKDASGNLNNVLEIVKDASDRTPSSYIKSTHSITSSVRHKLGGGIRNESISSSHLKIPKKGKQ